MGNASLGKRLILLCLGLSSTAIVVGTIGIMGLTQTAKPYSLVARGSYPQTLALARMNEFLLKIRISNTKMIGDDFGREAQAKEGQSILSNADLFRKEAQTLDKSGTLSPKQKELFAGVLKSFEDYMSNSTVVVSLDAERNKDPKTAAEARQKQVELITKIMPAIGGEFSKRMGELNDQIRAEAEERIAASMKAESTSTTLIVIGSLVALVVSGLCGYLFSRSIARGLQTIATNLDHGSHDVSSTSGQVAAASEQLSSSNAQQSAALQQTVSALEEVSAMVDRNAANANASLSAAKAGEQAVSQGAEAVGDMIQSIKDIEASNAAIRAQVDESNREISEIVRMISEIGEKTKVINDIVFQTKLLSFNASVEAARAGDHGKGFAVVAEEVGNLAKMSGSAAKEISSTLENGIRRAQQIVSETQTKVGKLIEDGAHKIEAGIAKAGRCDESLNSITTNMEDVGRRVTEIATASREQSQGISEISRAMRQLDDVTQQNSGASQSLAGAADGLKGQARELATVVSSLNALVLGSGHGFTHSVTPNASAPLAPNKGSRAAKTDGPTKPFQKSPLKLVRTNATASSSTAAPTPSPKEKPAAASSSQTISVTLPSESDPRFKDI